MIIFVFKCGKSIANYKQNNGKRRACPDCGAIIDFKIIWCEDCGKQLLVSSMTNNKLLCDVCKLEQDKIGRYEYYKRRQKAGAIYKNRKTAPVDHFDNDEIIEEYYESNNPKPIHKKEDYDCFNTIEAFRTLMGIHIDE